MKSIEEIFINTITKNKHYLSEAMKDGFSIEYLKNLDSFNKKMKYCREMLGNHIGKGSSRIVYQIDDNKVLKLAFNNKGLAQNNAEADWNGQNYGVLPKLFDADNDDSFIICEYVLPAKEADFKHCLNMSFNNYCKFIEWTGNHYSRRTIKYDQQINEYFHELIENNEWINSFYYYMLDYQLPLGDLRVIRNYGLANREGDAEIVLLDSGLTEAIWEEYYKK